MHRVIVLDPLAQEGLDLFDAAAGIEYEVRTGLEGDELRQALLQFDGAICRSGVRITAQVLEGNERLRAIARAGVGTDNIDVATATRLGIVVMNTPSGNTLSTAEHTIALILALSRNVVPANQSLAEGRWDRKLYTGRQLAGRTLGIIGLGRIGQAVAERAQAFGMRVLGYDSYVSSKRFAELNVQPCENVEKMLPEVDYLTVHTPLNDETRNLISFPEIELIKDRARVINCARGGIYDEEALLAGLESGKLAGVALDVYASEPCTDSPLFGRPDVVATPHLGASTTDAQVEVAVQAAEILIDFFTTGAITNPVNTRPLADSTRARLRTELAIAHRLGLLLDQWRDGDALKSCRLTCRGEFSEEDLELITSAFSVGLLERALRGVNFINATMLLEERGIDITSQPSHDVGDFRFLITADVQTDAGTTYTAASTTFGQTMPRLVRLDHHRLEAYLDGILLAFRHRDVPGIIGMVGTVFGNHNVNIAHMAVGRASDTPGGEAIGVLNLDATPPEEALEEVRRHPDIQEVRVIHLLPKDAVPSWLG